MEIVMHIQTKRSNKAETRTFTSTCDALNYMKRKGIIKIGVAIFENGTMRTNTLNTRVWGINTMLIMTEYIHTMKKGEVRNNVKCI